MKKYLSLLLCSVTVMAVRAQIPEDILKYTWHPVNGTARINAIGGAMGSLGGDVTATFTNPAGLAFYKTSDLVISPGLSFTNNKSSYRGTKASDKDSYFNLGTTGIVGGLNSSGAWSNHAISFAVTRTANFSNKIYYTGKNDYSSFGEQYAAEAANSGLSLNSILNSSASLGTKMAVYSFLIDTATLAAGNQFPDIVSMAMWDNLKNGGPFLVNQSNYIETSGGITEVAVGYAANMDDKIYLGGSLGIPIVKYDKHSVLREEDATGDADNNFDFAELTENSGTKGVGINGRIGLIVKPVEYLRLGLAIHTPTWYTFTDTYSAIMAVNLENYRSTTGTVYANSQIFTDNVIPKYKYALLTPWKLMLSGSYVLREVADVRQQKGFVTADIEYVTNRSNRFSSTDENEDNSYYHQLNDVIRSYYKNSFNVRVGGELKFTTVMARLGLAYYGNPYRDRELKASQVYVSGGLGYRNGGMFVDVSYVQGLQKDVNFPYRLPDKANTFSTVKGSAGSLMLTLGFKI